MQVYAVKLHFFFRYGDKNNTLVLDLTDEEKLQMVQGKLTMDEVYNRVLADPVAHVNAVKKRGLEKIMGIAGFTDGNLDYSNGTGKSTILEAICYAHYEKIVRKLANTDKVGKAGVAVTTKIDGKFPENMRQSFVEEIFEENGYIYRIKRGNSFTKSGKKDSPILEFECYTDDGVETATGHRKATTHKTIEEVNSNEYELFVNTQMFAQNDAGKFLVGADKTKKEMIISLLKVENIVNGCLSEIRIRKNAQDRKVETLRTSIIVMQDNLVASCKTGVLSKAIPSATFGEYIKGDLTQEHITFVTTSVKERIKSMENNVLSITDEITNKDKLISELSHSSDITLAKTLREDGIRINQLIVDKKQQVENQTKDLDKLILDTEDNIVKKNNQLSVSNRKCASLREELVLLKKSVDDVNVDEINAHLEKVKKVKELKPRVEETKKSQTEEKMEYVKNIATMQANKEYYQTELNGYIKQLGSVKGSTFTCKHCKSLVTKEHVEKQIEQAKENVKNVSESIREAEAALKAASDRLNETEQKLNKISDILLKESGLLSKLKELEMNKKRVKEIDFLISEYSSDAITLIQEIKDCENKKIEYNRKKEEVSKDALKEIEKLNKQLDEIREKYKQIKKTADDVMARIKKLTEERDECKKTKENIQKEIAVLNTHCDIMLKNWETVLKNRVELEAEKKILNRFLVLEDVFGLDGIQTRLVSRVLSNLNRYIKEYLDILTDGITTAKLIINDKSEVAMVISGASAETYEMLSGGEKMVVRLAVDIGLALLAFSKLSRDPELICLDEVFGPLDNFHKEAVFKVLERLNKKFNRVVIITHHPDIQKLIKNNIIIERDSGLDGMSCIKRIGEIPNYNFEQQLEQTEVKT